MSRMTKQECISKKKELVDEIFELRMKKLKVNRKIDAIEMGKESGSVDELMTEIFKLNKEIDVRRNKVDSINKKLYNYKQYIHL